MKNDVQMMRRNVELEARIIDDLLDLTRIARGLLSFTPETADVHELIRFLLNLSQSSIHEKQLEPRLELNASRYFVDTDASRLQQILWNILRNAIKFTDRRGAITVSTANDATENIHIRISDTGIGMTPETISRLAVPFQQSGRAGSDPHGGLGLGMAISYALVDLLHGRLIAESEGPGQGSSFTVTFPTVEARVVRSRPNDSRQISVQAPLRILLVEDHADTARVLVRLLKSRGFAVETADTVASAIAKVEDGAFDLLLCDIGLPDGTGFELMEQVRKICQTPALALTGFGTVDDVNRSHAAGFEAHITKPVNFHKLEATIWRLTGA
jgi:CheY-like chemotaxis protein/anti-sigma regulatory factor (Ser/Thr protein kinase)